MKAKKDSEERHTTYRRAIKYSQIFIAIDKHGSYTKRAEDLLEKTEVLRLSPGGNELFGRSWNVPHEEI